MRGHLVLVPLFLVWASAAGAAPVSVTGFGDEGWMSDDTRSSTGTDLVGLNTRTTASRGRRRRRRMMRRSRNNLPSSQARQVPLTAVRSRSSAPTATPASRP